MLSGPVALLGFTWCNVIWASGFVGIHMLKHAPNLVLACIEPLKVILLSRRSIQNIMNLLVFLREIVSQNDWRLDSVHWLRQQCSLRWFLCVTVYISAHQLHTTPHSSHVIICEMTFYFVFILFLFFANFFFQFLLHRPIFCLVILLERRFLPVDDAINSFSYPGFVIGDNFLQFSVKLYTLHRNQYIRTVTLLAHWYHLISRQKHPNQCSLKIL